ncbi:TMEM164 family acyltransferase [[Clostridium] scindens]
MCIIKARRLSDMRKQNHFYLYCGILILLSELWKQWCLTYILNHRQYNWWYFPFQPCSIPMYLCLVIPWVHYDAINMFYIRPHYYMN